ncbi:hypothetical protein K440DRAFT_272876 [Wilcoxina mikolae CBS 423.85]|nr:hypothetical protein K440DRAFT_272876 [Wilcoxina mikolae CBS 423.85]
MLEPFARFLSHPGRRDAISLAPHGWPWVTRGGIHTQLQADIRGNRDVRHTAPTGSVPGSVWLVISLRAVKPRCNASGIPTTSETMRLSIGSCHPETNCS